VTVRSPGLRLEAGLGFEAAVEEGVVWEFEDVWAVVAGEVVVGGVELELGAFVIGKVALRSLINLKAHPLCCRLQRSRISSCPRAL
jgi:hypothetical protein